MNKPYKVERFTGKGWYEVMLSPFATEKEVHDYIEKYKHYYPVEEQVYRIKKEVQTT
jgi:hypothetical protein